MVELTKEEKAIEDTLVTYMLLKIYFDGTDNSSNCLSGERYKNSRRIKE